MKQFKRAYYLRESVIKDYQEENARLQELNREMVEVLHDVFYLQMGNALLVRIKELIAKTEGE